MTTNQFKSFANGPAANVMAQNEWEILPALSSGFQSGKASSAQINKVLRQTSFIASAVAQYVAELSGRDVMDDGDIAAFVEKLKSAGSAQFLSIGKNLNEIASNGAASQAEARKSLGLGSSATQNNDAFLAAGSNLSDVPDKAHARANLGLGSAASRDIQESIDDLTMGKAILNGGALAVRSSRAQAGTAISNTNNLPVNAVSFVYSTAENSPGYESSLLSWGGFGGAYDVQLTASYSRPGLVKIRTKNSDIPGGVWSNWSSLYTTENKPTASDIGAISATGGDYNAVLNMTQLGTLPVEGNNAAYLYTPPGPYPAYSMVSCTAHHWYGNQALAGVIRGSSEDLLGWGVHINGGRVFHANSQGNLCASSGIYESGGAVRVYSPNNPPPQQDLSAYATSSWVYQNFVNDIDHTAPVEVAFRDGASYPRATDGAFMANLAMVGGSSNVGWFVIRYTRKLVGGNWYIIG